MISLPMSGEYHCSNQVTLTCSSRSWSSPLNAIRFGDEPGSDDGVELRDDEFVCASDVTCDRSEIGNCVTLPMNERISSKYDSSGIPRCMAFRLDVLSRSSMPRPNDAASASCFFMCRSKLVCWPKQRSHSAQRNGRSLLWIFRTCRCKLLDMLNDRSQYLHLYGCSPVCVRKCRVKLAERGNTLPQNLHEYRSLFLFVNDVD